ncbi:sulfate/molybdate ABC transporter ATP-binding protein [Brachybacterium hainanense]|uniref:Sulfate/molybdate ABC transporter ATP-binding protein n=1 Tax=Brachybacterium hainanense TaxID=1541174 RepID=A0ABV6RES0_9MICO
MSLSVRATVPERGLDVSLEVATGETLAVVGPNGAGKSTLLSLIAGTLHPVGGRILLDGRLLAADGVHVPPHARGVTTLTQDPVLFPHRTVLGNIMFPLRAQGVPRGRARAVAEHRLEEVGLAPLARRRPAQLSGGQAQRVAIARALAADPRLLLLDEPMAALDVDVAPALRELLGRFLAGRTAVIVTHDVLDAVTLADRIAVLEDGRLVQEGPTAELLARPRSVFAARFAGLNLLRGRWDGGGVRLSGGERIPATAAEAIGEGDETHLVLRPSAVTVLAGGAAEGAAAGGRAGSEPAAERSARLPRRVLALEPLGDLVRVRTEGLFADVLPHAVTELGLRPGAEITLEVAAAEATAYRIR